MRMPVNLASHPYENVRPLYAGLGIAGGLALILAAILALGVRSSRNETRMLTEQSAKFDRETTALAAEQSELAKWLVRPEVQDIRNQSDYLNSLILRKSLSWTQLFMDLEKVLPNQVMVTNIRPGLNARKEADLGLTVSAQSLPPLVRFLKNLESSTRFDKPTVASQHYPGERDPNPAFTLDLQVGYRPEGAEQPDMVTSEEEAAPAPAAIQKASVTTAPSPQAKSEPAKAPAPAAKQLAGQPAAAPVTAASPAPAAAVPSPPAPPAQPDAPAMGVPPTARRPPFRERLEAAPAEGGREAR